MAIDQRLGSRQTAQQAVEGIASEQGAVVGLELRCLGRPRPLQLQEGEACRPADPREGKCRGPQQDAPLEHDTLLAGLDESPQLRGELVSSFGQPGPAPGQLQPAEEG